MYRIKKVICCVIVLAILGSMPVNAKEVLQNENEAWDIEKGNARTILIIKMFGVLLIECVYGQHYRFKIHIAR